MRRDTSFFSSKMLDVIDNIDWYKYVFYLILSNSWMSRRKSIIDTSNARRADSLVPRVFVLLLLSEHHTHNHSPTNLNLHFLPHWISTSKSLLQGLEQTTRGLSHHVVVPLSSQLPTSAATRQSSTVNCFGWAILDFLSSCNPSHWTGAKDSKPDSFVPFS